MKSPRRSEQGFSLVEVLVSMVILSIGLLAVASMQINAGRMDGRSMGMTEGGAIAHGKMEELIGRPYDHPDLSDDPHPPQVREEYSLVWGVVEDTPIPKVKTVTVTVTWNETGLPKRYQLTYLKPEGI